MAPSTPPNLGARKRRVASPSSGITLPHLPCEATIPEPSLMGSPAATPHHFKAHTEQDDRTRQHGKHVGLLDLPCELLETIAFELCGSQAVVELGLVNHRMNAVVRQATARKLIVSRQIKAFLEMLGHHPELISQVSHVDLGDFGCIHHKTCFCLGTASLNEKVMKVIGREITTNTNTAVRWSHIRKDRRSSGGIWRAHQAFFINVLASLCPNIKSFTIELPEAIAFTSGRPPRPLNLAPHNLPSPNPELLPVAPFQGPALELMRQRLEVLTIAENTRWKGPATVEILEPQDLEWRNMGTHTITLAGFSKLVRLDIPMDALGRPHSIMFLDPNRPIDAIRDSSADVGSPISGRKFKTWEESRTKVIPLTIRYLHVRSCGKWTFAFLQRVNSVPVEHLKLKHIELFCNTGPEQLIALCNITDEDHFSYLELLKELTCKGIKISFYTGPRESPVDMLQELLALSTISSMEIWRFALSRMPCTALNRKSSLKRRSSTISSRLFLRHVGCHFHLFNSPTFEATSWAQGAFFHGVRNTKWDPELRGPKAKVRSNSSERAAGNCRITRRFPAMLNLDTFKFCFGVQNDLAQPPAEVPFLGTAFTFPENARMQQGEIKSNTKRQRDMKAPKQCHQGARAAETGKDTESLSINMTRLRLRYDSSDLTASTITADSRFNVAEWVGIGWKLLLQTKISGM